MDGPWPYAAFAVSFAAFALIHSLTTAIGVKEWLTPLLKGHYRLAYTVFSVITLAPAFVIYAVYAPSSPVVFALPHVLQIPVLVLKVLAVSAILYSIYQQGLLAFVGMKKEEPSGLVTTGLYGLVRHPIYFFGILFVWLSPVFTAMDLLVATMATVYFVVGAWHEDTRLEKEFGEEYQDYRQRVSMLIPLQYSRSGRPKDKR